MKDTQEKRSHHGTPFVHFEISGQDPQKLRSYDGDPFEWEFDTSAPVAETISQRANCRFVNRDTTDDWAGNPGRRWWKPQLPQGCDLLHRLPNVVIPLQKAEAPAGRA